jgi:hypothetical protein
MAVFTAFNEISSSSTILVEKFQTRNSFRGPSVDGHIMLN